MCLSSGINILAAGRPLPAEMLAPSDLPPPEGSEFWHILPCSASTVRDRKRSSTTLNKNCLSVCVSLAAFPHCCTDLDVSWGMVGVPSSCALRADLQSMHGFRCYNNIAPKAKCQRMLVLAVCLVYLAVVSYRHFRQRHAQPKCTRSMCCRFAADLLYSYNNTTANRARGAWTSSSFRHHLCAPINT